MQVGIGFMFQNPRGERRDSDVWRDVVALADAAESEGFDAIWCTEHHFTDYQMTPNPLQFLTYMAGRTRRARLGTQVVVLPWHDPVRVAEEVALLDTVSGGRAILGIGRGLGKVEFDGFRIPFEESRERFLESASIVIRALDDGVLEANGPHYVIPRRGLRPRPDASFRGRTYGAAVSPESARILAELGIGMIITVQKPWDSIVADLEEYRSLFRKLHGREAPKPIVGVIVVCDRDGDRARETALRYISSYYESVIEHYDLGGTQFKGTKGYEYYENMAVKVRKYRAESGAFFADLQVAGTPDECFDKLSFIRQQTGCDGFIAIFDTADLPFERSTASMKLFAAEVIPRLRAMSERKDDSSDAACRA
jgi:alkanesulfonate monooxygenase SsuD/methylene tetrahydromethanopterin reductase-like flavin-dependent oxidoreductase (luciferase family)